VNVDLYQTTAEILADCNATDCPKRRYDEVLNWQLSEQIEQMQSDRVFVTLLQTGSHGSAYYNKYLAKFEYFTPVCKMVQIAKCSDEELNNAYDNTIRYTDSLIADLISKFKQMKNVNAAVIYVADHS